MLEKQTPLGEILVRRGAMDEDDRADVEKLVSKHVRKHGGAQASVAALRVGNDVRASLAALGDADVIASLAPYTAPPTNHSIPPTSQPTSGHATGGTVRASPTMRYSRLRPHARGGLG